LVNLVCLSLLDLSDNRIEDIHPLATFTGLSIIDLGSNVIKDLKPLTNMSGLRILSLENNLVAEFWEGTNFKEMEFVNLLGNPFKTDSRNKVQNRQVIRRRLKYICVNNNHGAVSGIVYGTSPLPVEIANLVEEYASGGVLFLSWNKRREIQNLHKIQSGMLRCLHL